MSVTTADLGSHATIDAATREDWSYTTAFSRNYGLIDHAEQERLRTSRVAIAGMGGVGGIDLVTLARLGIGRFTIADPDTFEIANTNRQYGAMRSNYGRSKAETMAAVVRDINPQADVRIFSTPIESQSVDDFLDGANLFVDGIDIFEIQIRRLLFAKAASLGIHAVTAGPIGFSTAWLVFAPDGMTFDRYFDLHDGMAPPEMVAAFIAGVAPAATQKDYIDMRAVSARDRTGPSCGLACQLAAGVVVCEAVKILLRRGTVRSAPWYHQFDPYVGRLVARRLWGTNANPRQRRKRQKLLQLLSATSSDS